MLIGFRTDNYRSFGKERKLSMVAGKSYNHRDHVVDAHGHDVLTFSAIYGANASGKSSLVRAMYESREMIVSGLRISEDSWSRTDGSNSDRTTGFEYEFSTGSKLYAYGFDLLVDSGIIGNEWLIDHTDGVKRVFERIDGRVESDLQDDDCTDVLDVLNGLMNHSSDELLLRLLANDERRKGDLFSAARETMLWFRDHLVVTLAGQDVRGTADPRLHETARRILYQYGTGITDIVYEKTEHPPADLPQDLRASMEDEMTRVGIGIVHGSDGVLRFRCEDGYKAERIVFDHDGTRFAFDEESAGVQRLYGLIPIMEPEICRGTTYVIDDLDRCLHPLTVRRLVKDFLGIARDCENQLIATTHDTGLMDLNILRRDEIWFTERDSDGNADLYSLEDFRERDGLQIWRSYLDGRYGAVPEFRTYLPEP